MLKEKYQEEIDDILSRYPVKRSALIPLLYLAQREQGYITEAAMNEIAALLEVDASASLRDRHLLHDAEFEAGGKVSYPGLQIAHVRAGGLGHGDRPGSKRNWGSVQARRRADGVFTLTTVECLAACGTGPMMQINDDYYERLTEDKLDRILADLRSTGLVRLKSGPFMWPEPACRRKANTSDSTERYGRSTNRSS